MRPGKVRDERAVANDNAKQLFARLAAEGAMIAALVADSRRCAPGVAFFAYPGEAADGRAYIGEAVRRGAAAVVWEEAGFAWRDEWRVPNAAVPGLKQAGGRARRAVPRQALRGAVDVRRHRHQRQDFLQPVDRRRARPARREDRRHRHAGRGFPRSLAHSCPTRRPTRSRSSAF